MVTQAAVIADTYARRRGFATGIAFSGSMAGYVLVVALGASLLTVVPITPAGLGFAEAGTIVMLGWLGLDVPTAPAVTRYLEHRSGIRT